MHLAPSLPPDPHLHRNLEGRHLLFYIGATFDGKQPSSEEVAKGDCVQLRSSYSNIRIGLATSKSVFGPWTRRDAPVLIPRPDKWDSTVVTNPAPCLPDDGTIYLYYRSNTPKGLRIGVAKADCGSRALGHQVGADYLKVLVGAVKRYSIPIPDSELVCAPFYSEEGQAYFGALNCAMNVAYANRQIIAHRVRECFSEVFGSDAQDLGMHQIWDVGHNTGKLEEHKVDGSSTEKLVIHRKGATRAFGPGRTELPGRYREIGQPILVGGSMGTHSYILKATKKALQFSWGSAVHGAVRNIGRVKAKRRFWGEKVVSKLSEHGIIVKGHSMPGIAEEAPGAYKDVAKTVEVMECSGLAKKVVRLRPIGNVKG